MKKIYGKILLAAIIMVMVSPLMGHAVTKYWSTTSFTSMTHGSDYTWNVTNGGTWFIPANEYITSANLYIKDLRNWYEPEDDYMNIYLLNNPYTPSSWPIKTSLVTYSDTNGSPWENFSYDLTQGQIDALTSYLSDGKFGLGFDPNCHYYDSKIKFTIITDTVPTPEPATMVLVGLGLLGIAGIRRKIRH